MLDDFMDIRIVNFLKNLNLVSDDFFEFIEDKIVLTPSVVDISWFGCHPILNGDILVDIRVVVPEILTEKDMLINIHEFAHAIELYNELGSIYEERREEREKFAKKIETISLGKINNLKL